MACVWLRALLLQRLPSSPTYYAFPGAATTVGAQSVCYRTAQHAGWQQPAACGLHGPCQWPACASLKHWTGRTSAHSSGFGELSTAIRGRAGRHRPQAGGEQRETRQGAVPTAGLMRFATSRGGKHRPGRAAAGRGAEGVTNPATISCRAATSDVEAPLEAYWRSCRKWGWGGGGRGTARPRGSSWQAARRGRPGPYPPAVRERLVPPALTGWHVDTANRWWQHAGSYRSSGTQRASGKEHTCRQRGGFGFGRKGIGRPHSSAWRRFRRLAPCRAQQRGDAGGMKLVAAACSGPHWSTASSTRSGGLTSSYWSRGHAVTCHIDEDALRARSWGIARRRTRTLPYAAWRGHPASRGSLWHRRCSFKARTAAARQQRRCHTATTTTSLPWLRSCFGLRRMAPSPVGALALFQRGLSNAPFGHILRKRNVF